jgi:hypothetical protein
VQVITEEEKKNTLEVKCYITVETKSICQPARIIEKRKMTR